MDMLGPVDEIGASRSPLMCASSTGQIAAMELLIASGAKIDLTNEAGNTALMVTAKHDQSKALAWLMKQGANVNAKGPWGHTALIYAAYNGRVECLKLLLDAGADPFATATDSRDPNDTRRRYGAIEVAMQQGQAEALALIRAAQKRPTRL